MSFLMKMKKRLELFGYKYFEKLIEEYNRLQELPNGRFPLLEFKHQQKNMIDIILFFSIVKR